MNGRQSGILLPADSRGAEAVERLTSTRWTAGIIGLGYVGLPLAVAVTGAGLKCVGFDVATDVVAELAAGRSHVGDVADDVLRTALDNGLRVTSDARSLRDADVVIVCVPSPLGRNRQPDLSFIEAAAATVAQVVTPGTLIVLESTTYPGTTDDVMVAAATASGLELDREVFVAFSPERVDPGNTRGLADIPKVVGGVTVTSGQVAAAAYRRLVPAVHVVSSARAAEMTKLLENTYRAVNIGLINEIAQLADQLDIDVWEVVDAAATKPFGFHPFYPGPGVGGHCIPLDPQFLAWRAREARFSTRFIDLAEQINTAMPHYVASRIADLLNTAGKPVHQSRMLVVGVAYKRNIADDRESPAWAVLADLAVRGADLAIHDPLVGVAQIRERGYDAIETLDSIDDYDIAVVLTDHDEIDYEHVADAVPIVFDTRGVYRRRGHFRRANVAAL